MSIVLYRIVVVVNAVNRYALFSDPARYLVQLSLDHYDVPCVVVTFPLLSLLEL